jgi:hypothetical protein
MADVVLAHVVATGRASVVEPAVVDAALHTSAAEPAAEQAAEEVGPRAAAQRPTCLAVSAAGSDDLLSAFVWLGGNQRRMGDVLRPDPLRRVVPSMPILVAERHILDVDQDLVGALLVPHLSSGVPGVVQDCSNR